MLGFFAAFLIFCFDNTNLVSRIPMGISAGTIIVVIVVYVLYAWEFKNGTSQQWFSLKKAFVKDRVEHTKGRSEKAWFRLFPRRPRSSDLEVNLGSNTAPSGSTASPS